MRTIVKRIAQFTMLVAVLILTVSGTANAQRFRGGFGVRVGPRVHLGVGIGVRPFWDPLWGPYDPYWPYPYVAEHATAKVRVEGVPKQTEVFVDGYLAGTAGTFATTPGGHAITLFLPGYRTVTENIFVAPRSTVKVRDTLDRLAAGEVSAAPPMPARRVRAATPNQG